MTKCILKRSTFDGCIVMSLWLYFFAICIFLQFTDHWVNRYVQRNSDLNATFLTSSVTIMTAIRVAFLSRSHHILSINFFVKINAIISIAIPSNRHKLGHFYRLIIPSVVKGFLSEIYGTWVNMYHLLICIKYDTPML